MYYDYRNGAPAVYHNEPNNDSHRFGPIGPLGAGLLGLSLGYLGSELLDGPWYSPYYGPYYGPDFYPGYGPDFYPGYGPPKFGYKYGHGYY